LLKKVRVDLEMIMLIVIEKPTRMYVVCRLAFGRADLLFKYVKNALSRLSESGARGPNASYASGFVC